MTIDSPELLYLDLMKKCLTRYIVGDTYRRITSNTRLKRALFRPFRELLKTANLELVRRVRFDPEEIVRSGARLGETMLSLRRLDHLQACVTDVISRKVPGDLIETGVWRGGATIFMRAVLKAYRDTERTVWVADSFQGLPRPDPNRYPADTGDQHWTYAVLAVPLDEVKANFSRYGLLDDQVRFLQGWFKDTLPNAPIERLAVLRLDGDLYESTVVALRSLYEKVSVGGYVIVDDYCLPACKAAVDSFRATRHIAEALGSVDGDCVFWQRRYP